MHKAEIILSLKPEGLLLANCEVVWFFPSNDAAPSRGSQPTGGWILLLSSSSLQNTWEVWQPGVLRP